MNSNASRRSASARCHTTRSRVTARDHVCDSVGAGLMCLQTYLHLHDEGAVPFVQVEDGIAFLGYEVLEPGLAGADQIAFGAMAMSGTRTA